jgi:hypothetical protein
MNNVPELAAFLAAPASEVAVVAPATVIVAFGGLRRSAELAGVDRQSPAYLAWLRAGLVDCVDLLFRHGIGHVIAPIAIGEHLAAAGDQAERVLGAIDWGFAGKEALADYAAREWRVRLLGGEALPALAPTAERLREATSRQGQSTLWLSVYADSDAPLESIFAAVHRSGARTQAELIGALYGETIPRATLLLGFGAPTFSYDLIPPLLAGRLECYWMQRPGYALDEPMLRRILYDYAFIRSTGSGVPRNDRYADIAAQRAAWETDWVLGVGTHVGPFWYPAPFGGAPA